MALTPSNPNPPNAYAFDYRGMQRAVSAIKAVEKSGAYGGNGNLGGSAPQAIVAHITSQDTTDKRLYAWTQGRYDGGTTANAEITGALAGTVGTTSNVPAIDLDPSPRDLSNTYAIIIRGMYKTASGFKPCFYIAIPYRGSIECDVSTDGGVDGTQTTAPSYTYTATDDNGVTLGTMLAPTWARTNGSFLAATHGRGKFVGGTFVLCSTDEVPNLNNCDGGGG